MVQGDTLSDKEGSHCTEEMANAFTGKRGPYGTGL